MKRPLRVLIVEDSEDDTLLVVEELRRSGFDPKFERVDSEAALDAALARGSWELVIADYALPGFSGLGALQRVQRADPDLPVIVVSGAIGEETAVAAMRAGAADYVMKDNFGRLGPAVDRELREAADRRERRRAEQQLRKTSEELSEAQRDLAQSEKLAALGRFSSGLAHELKNPLGIIMGGAELLEIKVGDHSDEVRIALSKIKEAATRASLIVESILRFARPSPLELEVVEADALVKEAVSLFQLGIRATRIDLVAEYAGSGMRVRVDKNQIQQVIFNLLANAVDATPDAGRVVVRVQRVLLRDKDSRLKGWCLIEVVDRGVGIPKENLGRIFEPFFTTKRDQKGTGLGLSVARTIVEHHRGALRIRSEVDKGTVAQVILPLADDSPGTEP